MDLNFFFKAAELIGDEELKSRLQKISDLATNNRFYLSVWGHFSAGKSNFLNTLIGKNILPVQLRETTAILTYIHYSPDEYAELIYEDGIVKKTNVDIVRKIYHNSEEEDIKDLLNSLSQINVYVDCKLLKSGLILVDTPGVNSLIEKHKELAASAIENSGKILYVLGGTPSLTDKHFISRIADCNVDISFIRTKCDLFNTLEENPYETLDNDRKLIENILGHNTFDFIALSSEPQAGKFYNAYDDVKLLIAKLSDNLLKELHSRLNFRLENIKIKLLDKLNDYRGNLEYALHGNIEELNRKKTLCIDKIELLRQSLQSEKLTFRKNLLETTNFLQKHILTLRDNSVLQFSSLLDSSTKTDFEKEAKIIHDDMIHNTIVSMQSSFNSELKTLVNNLLINLSKTVDVNQKDLEFPTYSEVVSDNIRGLEEISIVIKNLKNYIDDLTFNRQKLGESNGEPDVDYDAIIAELDAALGSIPTEAVFKISENQPTQPSQILGSLGKLADLILSIWPLDGASKAGTVVSKFTNLPSHLNKTRAIGSIVPRSSHVYGSPKKVSPNEPTPVISDPNIFDMLSIANLAEMIGRFFDSPPTLDLDTQVMAERQKLYDQIYEERNRISKEKILKMQEEGLIKSEQRRIEIEIEEKKLTLADVQVFYEKRIAEHEKDVKSRAIKEFKTKCVDFYRRNISAIADNMLHNYLDSLEQNLVMLQTKHVIKLRAELDKELLFYNKLLDNSGDHILRQKISECLEIINGLAPAQSK